MKKQILCSFSIIFLVFGLGSAAVVKNLLNSTASLRNLINLHEIEDIRQNLNLRVQTIQAYVHLPAIDFSYNLDEIASNIQGLETAVRNCHGCHHQPRIRNDITYTEHLVDDFQEKLSYLITSRSDVAWRQNNQQQAIKISDAILQHVQEMVNRAAATLQHKTDIAMQGVSRTYAFLFITFIVTLIIGYATAQYLTNMITRPIDELLIATRKITAGELGYKTAHKGSEEFIELLETFNNMSAALAAKERERTQLHQDLEKKITELHKTQHDLVTAGKLASLGKLAGGIAHDFNNLLCGIIGHISLLKKNFPKGESSHDLLSTIEKASYRASKLVDKLQTYANLKEWRKEPINLNQIILAVGHGLTDKIDGKGQIQLSLDEDLALILGDRKHLHDLITNICDNAVQAIGDNGLIEISSLNFVATPNNQAHNLPDGSYIQLIIKDNGAGIDEKVLPHVYDPYFSTEELGSKKGMGLGMAIALSIVSNHNGHIHIDSAKGIGTSVFVYLPALEREPASQLA